MYKATLREIDVFQGTPRTIVDFEDGEKKFTKEFFGIINIKKACIDAIEKQVKQDLFLEDVKQFIADNPQKEIDLTPPEKEKEKEPTEEELAAKAFQALAVKYRGAQAAIKAGLLKETDASYISLVTELKSTYKEEYAIYLNGLY